MKRVVLTSFIIIFPLILIVPGFFDENQGFYVDWWTNIWNIEYQSRYFSTHHSMPNIIHTWNIETGIGRPDALFYGFLFYPIMAFTAQFLGTNIALRLGIVIIWIMQFFALKKVFSKLTNYPYFDYCVTALFLWGIYPLTNLYNRSALPEFFATGLLLCALCYFFLFLWADLKTERNKNAIFFGICLVLCIGTHPITALFGGTFLFITIFFCIVLKISKLPQYLPLLLIIIFFCMLSVSPWLYVTFKFMGNLAISSAPGISIYSESIDWPLSRFLPFPMDKRSVIHGWQVPGGTPWLEAQMNMPLLLLLLWVFYSNRDRLRGLEIRDKVFIVFPLLLFLLTNVMSLSASIWTILPSVYKNIQMVYRMVTYQNLSLVLALISVYYVLWSKTESIKPNNSKGLLLVMTLCLSISFVAATQKLMHGFAIMGDAEPLNLINKKDFLSHPKTVGQANYILASIPESGKESYRDIHIFPDPFDSKKNPEYDVMIRLEESSWIKTNIQAFPWNKLLLNGIPVPLHQYQRVGPYLSLLLPPGEHCLSYVAEPDNIYLVLKLLSWIVIVIWMTICGLIPFKGYFLVKD
jgi:hypothetical protein|tara:strand:- start:171 stop:1907 length:1737 start_codon:yes stop_codon:yes gene_type:complete